MFENAFKTELAKISSDNSLIEKLWEEIKQQYSKRNRHYHSLAHLDNIIIDLFPIKDKIVDWQTIVFSVAYHDIVYNTLKNDNEEKSAKLAYQRLTQLSLPQSQKDKCYTQILATKSHNPSDDGDTNFFTDADLAILGASGEVYRQYSNMIRKEYRLYPDIIYNPGRQKVLRHFLQMPNIYKTAYFRDKFENKAKQNLSSELKAISS